MNIFFSHLCQADQGFLFLTSKIINLPTQSLLTNQWIQQRGSEFLLWLLQFYVSISLHPTATQHIQTTFVIPLTGGPEDDVMTIPNPYWSLYSNIQSRSNVFACYHGSITENIWFEDIHSFQITRARLLCTRLWSLNKASARPLRNLQSLRLCFPPQSNRREPPLGLKADCRLLH